MMRGRVIAEWIGYGEDRTLRAFGQPSIRRPWIARIAPAYGRLRREFVRGDVDFEQANSAGSRGVRVIWTLHSGVYEVFKMTSWRESRRYFIYVADDGTVTEISKEDINSWASES